MARFNSTSLLSVLFSVIGFSALAQNATPPATPPALPNNLLPNNRVMSLFDARIFPNNYTIYGVNIRDYTDTTTSGGMGLFVTCDTGEIAVGAFCEEKQNGDATPNALITAGVATARSAACRWKNPGQYRVVASCLNITALKGDVKKGPYSQNQPLD